MTVQVAVIDPLPLFRHGAAAVLAAAGHAVQTPPDLLSWIRRSTVAVVVLTLRGETDWALLRDLRDRGPEPPVVALLEDESAATGVRAVRAGARSVLARTATAAALERTVAATIDGQAVLPAIVADALANGDQAGQETPSREKLSWLRALAAGTTIAELARQAGYSERAMFRLLRALYRELGAQSRVEALMRARDLGWL